MRLTVFPRIVSAETIFFNLALCTVHKSAETIRGNTVFGKLFGMEKWKTPDL